MSVTSQPAPDVPTPEIPPPPGTGPLGAGRPGIGRIGLPWWKKVCLAGASLLLVSGLALHPFEESRGAPREGDPGPRVQRNPSIPTSVLVDPGDPSTPVPNESGRIPPNLPHPEWALESENGAPSWSPALIKGGLSFLVGFCLGFVFRVFLKLTALVIGLNLAIYFGLSQIGVLEIHWEILNGYFDRLVTGFGDDFSELRKVLTGSLPSVGLATLGLFVGYRKS